MGYSRRTTPSTSWATASVSPSGAQSATITFSSTGAGRRAARLGDGQGADGFEPSG